VWFPWNRALAFRENGVMAFHVTGPQNRFTGCYIDGGLAIFDNTVHQVWTNGFECCAGLNVPRGIFLRGDVIGPGFVITNNIFEGGSIYHVNLTAKSPTVTNLVVQHNSFSGNGRGTRATLTLQQTNATMWNFNFCSLLIFPTNIKTVRISLQAEQGFPRSVVRPVNGNCIVTVETDMMTGTVTADVDTSTYTGDFV